MQVLVREELENMKGGISFWAGCAIVGTIAFIVGIFDGIVRPNGCK